MAEVAVVGGGIAGLAGARSLAQRGHDVTVLEAAPEIGGLVRSLEVGGTPIERFYHHVFPQERTIQRLIAELGLGDRFEWRSSTVGMLIGERVWPFTTATDLLRFEPLSVPARLRAGIGALRMPRVDDWAALDQVPARDWLVVHCGVEATRVVWEPLLRSKFGEAFDRVPAAWLWGRFDQRAGARRADGRERLGYLRGGFAQLFDALSGDLAHRGVTIRTGAPVSRVAEDGHRWTLEVDGAGTLSVDGVLWTAALPALAAAVGERADPRWSALGRLGVLSVILELDRPVTDRYWVNVCDPSVPYGALVEHTNLVPPQDYGGRHVVYLARYFTHGEPIAAAVPDDEADRWIADLHRRFPHVGPEAILDRHVSRAANAAPLVTLGHLERRAPTRTSMPRLHAATMAQIYPHDRGMNDGAELAIDTGDDLHRELADVVVPTCPVCTSVAVERRFDGVTTPDGECGVTGSAVRPSADAYGTTIGEVLACRDCGHGFVPGPIDEAHLLGAYERAADPDTLDELEGQRETANRALARIERRLGGRGRLLDVGCWTGTFLLAARDRGWDVAGLEPSTWAREQAAARGLRVHDGTIDEVAGLGTFDAVVATDVLEHLVDPAAALAQFAAALRPGGVLYLTVPDAGSPVARALGVRWWSVLPMHLQYFTRHSLRLLLRRHAFDVLDVDTHPKVFTARYYAERLAGYSPVLASAATGVLERVGLSERLVAPDLRDRVQVVARRSGAASPGASADEPQPVTSRP